MGCDDDDVYVDVTGDPGGVCVSDVLGLDVIIIPTINKKTRIKTRKYSYNAEVV